MRTFADSTAEAAGAILTKRANVGHFMHSPVGHKRSLPENDKLMDRRDRVHHAMRIYGIARVHHARLPSAAHAALAAFLAL